MADISNITIKGENRQEVNYNIKDEVSRNYITNNLINVMLNGVKGDGETDDTQAIQACIDNNPLSSLFFPKGNYKISAPLKIKTENAYCVNLYFDDNAKLFTNTQIESLLQIGYNNASWERYAQGASVIIDGGFFDATNTTYAIHVYNYRKSTQLRNLTIINVQNYGIFADNISTSTSNSTDLNIENCFISGLGSDLGGTGLYFTGLDNKVTNSVINRVKTAVNDSGGGSFYINVHMLASFSKETIPENEWTQIVAMYLNGSGNVFISNCYFDTYATSIIVNKEIKVYIENSTSYWWTTNTEAGITFLKANVLFYLNINNYNLIFPNGNNKGFDFSALSDTTLQYITNYQRIKISGFNMSNVATIDKLDYLWCREFYYEHEIILQNAWTVSMQQNHYYPIAYLKSGQYDLKIRMGNDQIIEAKISVSNNNSNIEITNIINSANSNVYKLSLCNGSTINNVYGAYLCVSSNLQGVGYNPCIFDGIHSYNCQIFSGQGWNNQYLDTVNVIVEKSFNS